MTQLQETPTSVHADAHHMIVRRMVHRYNWARMFALATTLLCFATALGWMAFNGPEDVVRAIGLGILVTIPLQLAWFRAARLVSHDRQDYPAASTVFEKIAAEKRARFVWSIWK
jgi:hypothetical protein